MHCHQNPIVQFLAFVDVDGFCHEITPTCTTHNFLQRDLQRDDWEDYGGREEYSNHLVIFSGSMSDILNRKHGSIEASPIHSCQQIDNAAARTIVKTAWQHYTHTRLVYNAYHKELMKQRSQLYQPYIDGGKQHVY